VCVGDAVEVEGLRKVYGGVVAVEALSFSVPHGCVFALLGPNGAGKTTTIECLEGFRSPDSGRVRVLGCDPVAERARLAPAVGVMLQGGGAWQAATAGEMIRLYARFYAAAHEPAGLLDRVGLADRAGTRYRALSGGERQRLQLALALVGRPRLVMLDEPTAGVDVRGRRLVWRLVEDLRHDGVTVLLTTHLTDEVERLADRVAVIDRGRLVALDTPAALLAGGRRVHVRAPGPLDAEALAAALGARVEAAGSGQWEVHAGPEAIPRITAWFAARDLPLTGIRGEDLGDVLLRLTGDGPP
jgi:ABC-2 type transport system ATP-binding protein